MTPSIEDAQQSLWAYDSQNKELDPELKAAHQLALQEHADGNVEPSTEPIVLRKLLSQEQIEEILEAVSVEGVWPRGVKEKEGLRSELKSVPHHFAWTEGHVALYMHNNDYWFVRELPGPWCRIRGGMESRPWMDGNIPELDEQFVGSDQSMMHVRSIELHTYGVGGGLITPGHRDCGSDLTISVLLSDPAEVEGGDFVTYNEGVPVAHKMEKGDAILFKSEDLHNICTITKGIRQSLVVELWPSARW